MKLNFSPSTCQQTLRLAHRVTFDVVASGLVAISTLVYTTPSAKAQELAQDHVSRKGSAVTTDMKRKDIGSAACAPKSDDAAVTPKPSASLLPVSQSQETRDEKSTTEGPIAPLTAAASSKQEWLKDEIQRDESTQLTQPPHSEEPANSDTGSDRQCTSQQGSLKTEPVTPH
jgi:hypothetical protein